MSACTDPSRQAVTGSPAAQWRAGKGEVDSAMTATEGGVMMSGEQRFNELKRRVYQFILPTIAAAFTLNILIAGEILLMKIIHSVLLIGIVACWVLLWTRVPLIVPELIIPTSSLVYLLAA